MIDQEQDWINKYRAALSTAIPAKQSRVEAFAVGLSGLIQKLVSAIGRAFREKTSAALDVKTVQELSCLSVSEAVAPAPSLAGQLDGPGTRSPRKRHFPGQEHRRMAG
jgi:hypothetical protein